MKTYAITQMRDISSLQTTPSAVIDRYPWEKTGYKPKAEFQMAYGEHCFFLRYAVIEKELRTEERRLSPNVYKDSAVELFLMPAPQVDARYINLEFNALGAMYIGVGTCRDDNILLYEESVFQFDVQTVIQHTPLGYQWSLTAQIPFLFLSKYSRFSHAAPGTHMRGNFYKICDGGQFPHYGSWSPITSKEPDFHRPECFGDLLCC